MIFCTTKFPKIDRIMQEGRISRHELSKLSGIKYDTLGYKLRNEAAFTCPEMCAIQKAIKEKTGEHYFLDEIFTTGSEEKAS